MSKPKVAIITRTKDRPLLLERAINSILNQTFEDWVHVIVNDNGDKNNIKELTKKYKDLYKNRLKIVHNSKSVGMDPLINIGINNSKSKYIAILDDDDTWEKDFLENAVLFLENDNNFQAVMTHLNYVIEKIEEDRVIQINKYPFNTDITQINLFNTIIKKVFPAPVSLLIKRKSWEELKGINKNFVKYGDNEFILRFLEKYDMGVLPKILANYHVRPYNQANYSNATLTADSKRIESSYWENKLKNHLLRTDLNSNKVGLGFIYNFLSMISPYLSSNKIKEKLSTHTDKKIVLYGAGIRTNELLENFRQEFSELNISGILDQDTRKHGTFLSGIEIYPPEKIKELNPEILLITVANTTMIKPFAEKLIEQSKISCQILTI